MKDRGSTCKFRKALNSCITKFTRGPSVINSYLHEKQTSRIQSLNEVNSSHDSEVNSSYDRWKKVHIRSEQFTWQWSEYYMWKRCTKFIIMTAYMWTSRREDEFSSFFRSSPVLKYPPVFSWLLHVPPVFSWLLHVHVPNVQFAPCAFRPRKQDAIWMTYLWYFESLYTVQKSFILTSKFVLTTLYTHPGLIISHLVDDLYLNIC